MSSGIERHNRFDEAITKLEKNMKEAGTIIGEIEDKIKLWYNVPNRKLRKELMNQIARLKITLFGKPDNRPKIY